jgi:protein-S-isoprenylcysteine O-methyltransferase Ste14
MNLAKLALPFAVFGFLLIIATGTSMLLNESAIPLFVSIIGLLFLIIAMILRKKEMEKK